MSKQKHIFRVKKEGKYFTASNEPFNDTRLSWEARGVMGYLLSKPDVWVLNNTDLKKKGPAGDKKIEGILRELKKYSYLRRYRYKTEGGRFEWVTEIYESPSLNPDFDKSAIPPKEGDGQKEKSAIPPLPSYGEPSYGEPLNGSGGYLSNPDLSNPDLSNNEGQSIELIDKSSKDDSGKKPPEESVEKIKGPMTLIKETFLESSKLP